MDKFGRIVLPKAVRDGLGLGPGDALEVRETADGVLLQAAALPLREVNGLLVFDGELAPGAAASALADARDERLHRLVDRVAERPAARRRRRP